MNVTVNGTANAAVAPPRRGIDLTALWTLYVLTLRQHLRGKRWMAIAFLFLLAAGLAVVGRISAPDSPSVFTEFILAFMFIPQALLPLVALTYASGVIQDELEEQTITYLLIRPIPKWALYITKMLATLTTTIALTVIFTLLTYIAIYAGTHEPWLERFAKAACVHSLAVIAYCCLFGLMSLISKRALVMGVLYAAIVEGLLANLPLSIRLITVIYYTRVIAYRTLSFIASPNGFAEDIANDAWQMDIANDPHLLEHPQLNTCLSVLLMASLAFVLIGAWICSRKEFYVKTPEKS